MKKSRKEHKKENKIDEANAQIKVPIGAKAISILYMLFGAAAAAISFFVIGYAIASKLPNEISPALAILFAAMGVIFAVIIFFISLGIWNGKNWARISIATFNCMYVFVMVVSLGGFKGDMVWRALLNIVLAAIIAAYLLFNKEVRGSFR